MRAKQTASEYKLLSGLFFRLLPYQVLLMKKMLRKQKASRSSWMHILVFPVLRSREAQARPIERTKLYSGRALASSIVCTRYAIPYTFLSVKIRTPAI